MPANEQKTFELIHNSDFVKWVLNPNDESTHFWEAWLNENPTRKKEFEHSRFLIHGLVRNEKLLSETEVSVLWDKIEHTNFNEKKRFNTLKRWSAAAGILLILGFSSWLMIRFNSSNRRSIDYQRIVVNVDSSNDIKLILADHTQKSFSNKEVEFNYSQSGKLKTKTEKEDQTEDLQQTTDALQMNQLVVPRGKRSNILLADGTKLWLNSGSRAIYPVAFNGKTREIFIEGEGYLEVAHDAIKPFYVVTDQVKVKVLGTKFDISDYKDDCRTLVVLVEGSIEATFGTKNLIMKPNDLANYQKQTHQATTEKTNVLPYISWKDGWMLCNKEPIHVLTLKISRYYDLKISFTDPRINDMTLTGKLDLKNNYEDVFKIICATAPLKYEIIGDSIFLSVKDKK